MLTTDQIEDIKIRRAFGEPLGHIAEELDIPYKFLLSECETLGISKHRTQLIKEWSDQFGRPFTLKSTWELKTAKWLDLNFPGCWDYEVRKFLMKEHKNKVTTYTPDFWIYEDDSCSNLSLLIDVKGRRNPEQIRRIELFKLCYPTLKFEEWDRAFLLSLGIL